MLSSREGRQPVITVKAPVFAPGGAMQREIRLTPILLVVLGITTALVLALILLLWTFLPANLQSGLPFAISTVVVVNTALLRAIPILGKRLAAGDTALAQQHAPMNAQLNAQAYNPAPARVVLPPQQHYAAPAASPATKTCRRCGKVAQADDAFCRQCGNALAAPPLAAAPMAQPLRAPVGSAPMAAAPMAAAWSGGGPVTSLGGAVAVSTPVHRFMSKRALRYLLFIGTGFNVFALALYFLIGLIVDSCSAGAADVTACSPSTVTTLNVLLVLALIISLPGIVLVLLADLFALIRVALVRRWGWFATILVTYFFFWNVAMFLYVFIGPEEPPARQYPAVAKGPPR